MNTTKIFVLCLFSLCFSLAGFAQTDSLPLYQRFPDVPPFTLTRLPDSSHFAKNDLRKKTATLIIVFSPDCDHCQHATEDLLKNDILFKDVQIVMATPLEYRFIPAFYEHYNLAAYKNITIGRDPTNFLGTFFGVKNFPSIFLYSKKGKFVKAFEGSVSFAKIAEEL